MLENWKNHLSLESVGRGGVRGNFTNILLDEDVPIQRDAGEDVDAVHPQEGQQEAGHLAELGPKFPAELEGGGEVHRDAEHRHDQLGEGDVHQEKVELRLQLKHESSNIVLHVVFNKLSRVTSILLTFFVHYP